MSATLARRRLELRHATWSLDLSLTGLIALGTFIATIWVGSWGSFSGDALLSSVVMVAVVLIRRRQPLLMMLVVTLCCLWQVATIEYPMPALVVVPLTAYSVARWVPGRLSRIVLLPGLVGSVLGPTRWMRFLFNADLQDYIARPGAALGNSQLPLAFWLLGVGLCSGLVLTSYAIGRRVRESALARQATLVANAQHRQLELAEREQATRTAEANIRAQIARELHDVVAHSLSVMVVQAEGGRAMAARRPEQAVAALDTIAETGRDALTQMRRIVGVLRGAPDEQADFAPSPGLGQIAELVSRSGDGRVRLLVTGAEPPVPQTLGLVVYRVVQEAVTNFLKHAGPGATAQVQLSYSAALIVVEVLDDGAGGAVVGDGRGHGLQGMHERVASMGGSLEARPRKGAGFLVRAVLPVPDGGVVGGGSGHPSSAAMTEETRRWQR